MTLVLLLALVLASIVAIAIVPRWQVRGVQAEPDRRLELENECRTTIGQILGGLVILFGLLLAYQELELNRDNARRTEERQLQARIADSFARAIDQLGATDEGRPVTEIRLGGLYTLSRIGREAVVEEERAGGQSGNGLLLRDYHGEVMDILAAYVRGNAPQRLPETVPAIPLDVQTALRLLTDPAFLPADSRRRPPDLRHADLRGAGLRRAALGGADLTGSWLDEADLTEADLSGGRLAARLPRAKLFRARLARGNLAGADLQGADLSEADLAGAFLMQADLRGARLRGANLRDASLAGADLTGANIEAAGVLAGSDLTGVQGLTAEQRALCRRKGASGL